ncbi:MAG: histidine kinase [Chitinophaga sp.]|uniref:sensor histidine kinase n=1 Tax=Chitinophaga sp. TaxID=1869181 RepID=UPI0025C2CFA1|nr:histidine kinase [Chitinophaga sp.]MBV8251022.1 histidine kinase [Chitinophaga sp.]
MESNQQYNYRVIGLHVLIWSLILLLPYLISNAANDYKIGPLPGLFFTLAGVIYMAIFYLHAYVLYPRWWNKKKWWLYIITVLLLLMVSFQLKWLLLHQLFPDVLRDYTAYKFIFAPSVIVYVFSLIYCRVMDNIAREKHAKEQQAQQLATELKFLRSQVNPHFLFNVLTNLVALARKKSDQLEPALLKLSELMRYMLYDASGKKVTVRKETEYLENYISLQRLRLGHSINIETQIQLDEVTANSETDAMLLIPFVENAFKHGIGLPEKPTIRILLTGKDKVLTFEVHNQYADHTPAHKDDGSGIGLANVKARLQLLYPDQHTLTISDVYPDFHVKLMLQLP